MSFIITSLVILFIITLLYILNWFLNIATHDAETMSVYECGFEPFSDAMLKFDMLHWILALLYLIFDLELIFLFPFGSVISFSVANSFFYLFILFLFLFILTLGFVYEWTNNALRLEDLTNN